MASLVFSDGFETERTADILCRSLPADAHTAGALADASGYGGGRIIRCAKDVAAGEALIRIPLRCVLTAAAFDALLGSFFNTLRRDKTLARKQALDANREQLNFQGRSLDLLAVCMTCQPGHAASLKVRGGGCMQKGLTMNYAWTMHGKCMNYA